jgi:putative addiction module component (TIGR02574 family)
LAAISTDRRDTIQPGESKKGRMMSSFSEVLNAALTLPPSERGELAEVLWESMDEPVEANGEELAPEISAAWRNEIARRSAAYMQGELTGIPWSQVRDEVKRKHQRHA